MRSRRWTRKSGGGARWMQSSALLRESLNQPLMVIFEDLHWIDEETRAFLNLLADSIGTAKILLLVNYRPEYSHRWGDKTYYTQLRLDPLGARSRRDAHHVAQRRLRLAPFKRLIIDKTEGNPFFMEETSSLCRGGRACPQGPRHAARSNAQDPGDVQAILASRIDRLPPPKRTCCRRWPSSGVNFPSLIRAVAS